MTDSCSACSHIMTVSWSACRLGESTGSGAGQEHDSNDLGESAEKNKRHFVLCLLCIVVTPG